MGTLAITRRGGSAVLLPYDVAASTPVRGTVGSLQAAAYYPAVATEKNTGRVVVIGGASTNDNNAANGMTPYVKWYAPNGGSGNYSNLTTALMYAAAATLGDGNIVFGGGRYTSYNHAAYKMTGGVVSNLGSIEGIGVFAAAAADGNGNVLFAGGRYSNTALTRNIYKVSPDGSAIAYLGQMATNRMGHAAVQTDDGGVLFAGGSYTASPTGTSPLQVDKVSKSGVVSALATLTLSTNANAFFMKGARDGEGKVWFINSVGDANIYDKNNNKTTMTGMSPLSTASFYLTGVVSDGINIWVSQMNTTTVIRISPAGVKTTMPALAAQHNNGAMGVDGSGNVYVTGGAAVATERYVGGTAVITAPVNSYYRFNEHTAEQQTATGLITVATPNSGYVKIKKGKRNV